MSTPSKHELDNRANQLNPTHPAFYLSRGHDPEDAQNLARQAALELSCAPHEGTTNGTTTTGSPKKQTK